MASSARRKKRVLLLYQAKFGAAGEEASKLGLITKFSDLGACVKTNDVLPVGTKVHIVMEKSICKYEADGVVVWSRSVSPEQAWQSEYGMGVEFTSPGKAIKDLYSSEAGKEPDVRKFIL